MSDIFGLSIGHHSIRVATLKRSYLGMSIESIHETSLPRSPWLKTGMRDKEQIAATITQLIAQARPRPINTTVAVCSLPESAVFSKTIQLPKLSKRELQQTIPYETADFLPLPIEEVYLDWQVHSQNPGSDKKKQQIFVVAAPKMIVDDLLSTLKMAHLTAASLETEPFAICRSLQHLLHNKQTSLILDVNQANTTIVLANKKSIQFSLTLLIGNEKILRNPAAALTSLGEEIEQSLSYYHNRLGATETVKEVILTGSGALLPNLCESLYKYTQLPCRVGHPPIVLPNKTLIDPRFTTVLGLAMWQPEDIRK